MEYSLNDIIRRYDSGEPLEYVFFWGHHSKPGKITKACFSQWYPCNFEVDDNQYNCAEQYMMAEKARVFKDEEVRQKVLASDDPQVIKALGREVKNFDPKVWTEKSKEVVVRGNMCKFAQNMDIFHFLHETGNKILVEASPYDTIWGIGMKESEEGITNPHNWKGENRLGFALMEVRDSLLVE